MTINAIIWIALSVIMLSLQITTIVALGFFGDQLEEMRDGCKDNENSGHSQERGKTQAE